MKILKRTYEGCDKDTDFIMWQNQPECFRLFINAFGYCLMNLNYGKLAGAASSGFSFRFFRRNYSTNFKYSKTLPDYIYLGPKKGERIKPCTCISCREYMASIGKPDYLKE